MRDSSLPKVVLEYINASNAHDVGAYLNTFTDNSVIIEQSIGRDLIGRGEIEHYFTTYFIEYDTHTEIIDFTIDNSVIDMRVLFKGHFPEGEIIGLYQFHLKDNHIEQLRADLE
ncbi:MULTISPECIES: hypothetical protein [Paenibacillus]|uniref:hypothetical protein n=1 Tax=Paenibacillus TaxID=44249 RepID=UPI00201E290E|nr:MULTISPECIES: hypothetical protein [Paenibacillus]MCL6663894.1 hypothetical protein [Paenibacillus amylolyticus]UOK61281.1 hypothetical protein MT997_22295 [Paenibacillus sp. OVF10]WJM05831.1 hypothetical protein QNO02_16210 [Paenibacillus sp. PK1-4R]